VSPATGARRRAREVAFRVAYQADVAGDAYPAAWALRREDEERLSGDQLELIEDLVAALAGRGAEVDAALQGALEERWALARLAATDRAVLRVAVAELLARPGSPARVVLDEAIEIARTFGSEESGSVRERRAGPRRAGPAPGGVRMKHGIVSDVHANLEALEACLADAAQRGIEDFVCLGDFVGLRRLAQRVHPDAAARSSMPPCSATTTRRHSIPSGSRTSTPRPRAPHAGPPRSSRPAHLEYLRDLPFTVAWSGARLAHGSPAEPEEWNYVFTPAEAVREMDSCAEPVCFVGHSHVPGTFEMDGRRARYTRDAVIAGRRDRRYLIVVPSVGQPRDGDARAGYLLWDDEAWTFEHVRLGYDIEGAIARIEQAGLPRVLGERLRYGE
jgi:transcription antitermination factor NusB